MVRYCLSVVVVIAALGLGADARAHGRSQSHYGGQITAWGQGGVVEIVVRDGEIRAWIRDGGGKPVPASGTAKVVLESGTMQLPLSEIGRALTATSPEIRSARKLMTELSLRPRGQAELTVRYAQEAFIEPCLSPSSQGGKGAFDVHCASCHGSSLRGTDKGPSLLLPVYGAEAGHDDSSVLAAMAKGVKSHMWRFGDMPKPTGLKAGEAETILSYIRAAQAENAHPQPASAEPPVGGHHHK